MPVIVTAPESAFTETTEMLLQEVNGKILLFPAWPRGWDVHFKLHAPGQTTVEAEWRGEKLVKLTVTPKEREKDVINCL